MDKNPNRVPHALFHGFRNYWIKGVRGQKLSAVQAPVPLKTRKKAQTDQGFGRDIFVKATGGVRKKAGMLEGSKAGKLWRRVA
jgi:hypothetical protein